MQTINFSPCTHTKGKKSIVNSTNTPLISSLCSFFLFRLLFLFSLLDLRVLETSFFFSTDQLNLTQQLKFFRRRFEIVCAFVVQFFVFLFVLSSFRRQKKGLLTVSRGRKSLTTRGDKNLWKLNCEWIPVINQKKAIYMKITVEKRIMKIVKVLKSSSNRYIW
jgi:hypothetical protein